MDGAGFVLPFEKMMNDPGCSRKGRTSREKAGPARGRFTDRRSAPPSLLLHGQGGVAEEIKAMRQGVSFGDPAELDID